MNEQFESAEAIEKLLNQGRLTAGPQVVSSGSGNIPYVVIPNDCHIESLDKQIFNDHNKAPERIRQKVTVNDADSFVEYYNLFSDPNSRVFADETKIQVRAVLDYHGAKEGAPRWGQHTATLVLRHSPEWTVWTKFNNAHRTQQEFAEFLEQYAINITTPSPATMMEVANDLEAKTDVEFGAGIKMADGSMRIKYSEKTTATVQAGALTVPDRFTVTIPVYVGGPTVQIEALLRFRSNQGALKLWYTLIRPDEAARQGFLAIRNQIADKLSITILNGSPE